MEGLIYKKVEIKMKKLLIGLACLTLSSLSFASQTCITSSDGITICSNPDGTWG